MCEVSLYLLKLESNSYSKTNLYGACLTAELPYNASKFKCGNDNSITWSMSSLGLNRLNTQFQLEDFLKYSWAITHLQLFHSFLVSFLHTVHLCPQVRLLVLEVCLQFCQLKTQIVWTFLGLLQKPLLTNLWNLHRSLGKHCIYFLLQYWQLST